MIPTTDHPDVRDVPWCWCDEFSPPQRERSTGLWPTERITCQRDLLGLAGDN